MTKLDVRIKCLELCNRLDLKAEDIIAKAEVFEKWIAAPEDVDLVEKVPTKKGRPSKTGNTNILD